MFFQVAELLVTSLADWALGHEYIFFTGLNAIQDAVVPIPWPPLHMLDVISPVQVCSAAKLAPQAMSTTKVMQESCRFIIYLPSSFSTDTSLWSCSKAATPFRSLIEKLSGAAECSLLLQVR